MIPRDLILAGRAERTFRIIDREPQRHPVNTHVKKRPDRRSHCEGDKSEEIWQVDEIVHRLVTEKSLGNPRISHHFSISEAIFQKIHKNQIPIQFKTSSGILALTKLTIKLFLPTKITNFKMILLEVNYAINQIQSII